MQLANAIIPSQFEHSKQKETVMEIPQFELPIDKHIILVSDASVQNTKSAYSWVIANQEHQVLYIKSERIQAYNITSYRAELIGILSALQFISILTRKTTLTWELHCDNQAAINQINQLNLQPIQFEQNDSDILYSIQNYITNKGRFYHVKGHTTVTQNTTLAEKLNIVADLNAKKAINSDNIYIPPIHTATIHIQNKQIFQAELIVSHCQRQRSIQYWEKRLGYQVFNLIDWEMYKSLGKNFKQEVSIIKLFSGLTPTAVHQCKIGKRQDAICPVCGMQEETISHVVLCPENPNNIRKYETQVIPKIKSYGDFSTFIQTFVIKLRNPEINLENFNDHNQELIGWHNIWQGKLSNTFVNMLHPLVRKSKAVRKITYILLVQLIKVWKHAWLYRVNFNKRMVQASQANDDKTSQYNKLRYLYDHKHMLPLDQQKLLHSTLEEHLKSSEQHILLWLSHQYEGLKAYIESQKQKHLDNMDLKIPCEAGSENPD